MYELALALACVLKNTPALKKTRICIFCLGYRKNEKMAFFEELIDTFGARVAERRVL